MSGYFKDFFTGAQSLAVGMGITLKYFFQPVVTMQYPYETAKIPPRYRGHIELVPDEETGGPKCVACMMCVKGCPSGCITVVGKKKEDGKGKEPAKYELNFTTCSLCGQCVESCKFGAITFSKDYNIASTRREDYVFDLLQRLREKN